MTDAAIVAGSFAPGRSDAEIEAAAARTATIRRNTVLAWRWGILAAILALWEWTSRAGVIDEFFFARPSAIFSRLVEWMTEGTAEGPLWYHLWVTMEESLIGFVTGAAAGIVVGVALGRNRMLADIFSVYIKVINSIPRVVLAPIFIMIFGLGLASSRALLRDGVLRCLRQRLPGRARG